MDSLKTEDLDVKMFYQAYQAGLIPGLFFEICRILASQIAIAQNLTEKQQAQTLEEIVKVVKLKLMTKNFNF